MSWTKLTATDYKDCLSQIIDFVTKAFSAGTLTTGTNTGDGTLYGQTSSNNGVAETWTITCTTAGGSEVAEFSVVGGTTGTLDSAVCDTPYYTDYVSFTILSGDTDFAVDDSFTFDVSAITAQWSVNESDLTSDQQYALLVGTGGGSDEIFIGFRTQTDDSTYYNMEVSAFSGYVDGSDYEDQPGYQSYYACMSSVSFDFWLFMTGRHIKAVPIIGTVYECMYSGWLLANATTSQYNYPIYVGGSTDDVAQLVGGTEDDHTCFWRGYSDEYSGAIHDGSSWVEINEFIPASFGYFSAVYPDLDGNRVLYPCELLSSDDSIIYGRLDGVYYPTNADSALTTNDVLNDGATGYIVFQDVSRVGAGNVVAFDLAGDD